MPVADSTDVHYNSNDSLHFSVSLELNNAACGAAVRRLILMADLVVSLTAGSTAPALSVFIWVVIWEINHVPKRSVEQAHPIYHSPAKSVYRVEFDTRTKFFYPVHADSSTLPVQRVHPRTWRPNRRKRMKLTRHWYFLLLKWVEQTEQLINF